MDSLRRKLIQKEIESRSRAAEALDRIEGVSDSAYLLRLLVFELLLKLVVEEVIGRVPPKHHRYAEIFKLLPIDAQEHFLNLAKTRIGPSALNMHAMGILEELGSNFISLRYPYEKYIGLSEAQYANLGPSWIAAGGKLEQATFRYHPEELFGLTYAAEQMADYQKLI